MDIPAVQDQFRIKIGEVFQLHTKETRLVCSHCEQEFDHFTVFSQHIQEHLQQLWQHTWVILEDVCDNDCFQIKTEPLNNEEEADNISDDDMGFWPEEPLKQEKVYDSIETGDQVPAMKTEFTPDITYEEAIPTATSSDGLVVAEITIDSEDDARVVAEITIDSEDDALEVAEITIDSEDDEPIADFFDLFEGCLDASKMSPEQRYDKMLEVYHAKTSNAESLHMLDKFEKKGQHRLIDSPESRMLANYVVANNSRRPKSGMNRKSCLICGHVSSRSAFDLDRHIFVHSKERLFNCMLCDQTFQTMRRVIDHKRKVHGLHRNDPNKKDKPQKSASLPDSQTNGVGSVNMATERRYIQIKCKRGCRKRQFFDCPKCHEKGGPKCDGSHKHMNKCGSEMKQQQKSEKHIEFDKDGKPIYKCDICPKTFRSLFMFHPHRRLHSEPMAFHCKFCNLGFMTETSNRLHENKHTRQELPPLE